MLRIRLYSDNCQACGRPRIVVYNGTANASMIYCITCGKMWPLVSEGIRAEEPHIHIDDCKVRLYPKQEGKP